MVETISPAQARRIALASQGIGRPTNSVVGTRQLNAMISQLGLLQLDSVNVFERSHYLPAFARLGSYDKLLLDRLAFARKGRYIEYWAHEAAVIPIETWPLLRWRMQRYRQSRGTEWSKENRSLIEWVRAELANSGPQAASKFEHEANKRTGPWWGHSPVKVALEVLFRWGEVVSAGRTRFERTYALPQQVLPSEIIERDIPAQDAQRSLVEHAALAHGIGTASDLADYFRLKTSETLPAIHDLEDAGVLIPVTVPGWKQSAWLHRDARIPRRIQSTALLSPFDPVVWDRKRTQRLFDFHYRIEIYTPEPKRIFGYYSLPILVDDRLVGRIDLKSDRKPRVLRVQAAWVEEGIDPGVVAERVAPILRRAASWQGLEEITVADRGDLAPLLAEELSL